MRRARWSWCGSAHHAVAHFDAERAVHDGSVDPAFAEAGPIPFRVGPPAPITAGGTA
jgi:hypothetical protein